MLNFKRVFLTTAALLAASSLIWTHAGQAQAETQVAEGGGVYKMPAGDHVTAADYATAGVAIRRRSPTPDAELVRIKGGRAASEDTGTVVSATVGRPLYKECLTNVSTGFAPSDIHGAASPTNLVVVTNVNISVRNKTTCALVSNVPLKTFFNNFTIPATETLFDPNVVFDRIHNRCIVSVESRNSGNTDQFLYIAASTNSACTSWRRIRFVLSRVSPSAKFCKALATDFYDYPHIGYMGARVVVTSNNFPTAGGSYGTIMSINLTELLSGAAVSASCFRTGIPTNISPSIVSGGGVTQMFLLSTGSGSGSALGRRRLNVGADTPNDTLTTLSSISIPAWTAPPDAAQPNGQKLDTLDGRFQSATKQIGSSLWNVHAINSGGVSRWRLYKLSTSGTTPLFTFTPSTATAGCTTQHLFNPSVDTNSAAAGTLAFVTSSRTCPSVAGTGNAAMLNFRGNNASTAGWIFNTVQTSSTQFATDGSVACNSNARGSCRWGDYSATQIDPSNTARAWGFNQLVTGTTMFNWETRAGLTGP